jgi:ribose transport system substrate-binding protein
MRPRPTWALAAAGALALSLSACGGGDTASTGAGTASQPARTVSSAELDQRLAADYRGTFKELPATGPKGVTGKTVAIIPITQLSPTFSAFTKEAKDAAAALGWKTFVIDGKISTQGYNSAIRQAISQHPDAILLSGINCDPIRQAVLEAKKAGIVVYSVYGDDCDPPVWDGKQPVDTDAAARMRADWVASRLGPEGGKVIESYVTDDPVIVRFQEATERALKEVCPKCEVVRVEWALGDLGDAMKGKIATGLLRNPDAKAFLAPFDASILFGSGADIQGSGMDLAVMGGECSAPNMELIREGKQQNACTGYPFSVFGWSSIDALNRIFAGQEPVEAGLGVQLVDKEHNLAPAGDDFLGPLADFREHYKTLWGVG